MSKTFKFSPLLLVAVLFGCGGGTGNIGTGGAPQITSFTANPSNITAAGQTVTLSWTVTGGVTGLNIDQGVGPVSGTSTVVYPTGPTTYTLTATNSSGSDTATATVALGTGPGGPLVEDGLPPSGTFGVSLTPSDFQSDQGGDISTPNDERIVLVEPGGVFYALVSYSDPGGIAGVNIFLANSSPPGLKVDLVLGQSVSGFTLNGEVGGCILDGTQTTVNCIYEIAVGDIPNITALPGAGDEFAYVFRVRVTDAAGNVSDTPPRGYVVVENGVGTPTDPNPPSNPDPPSNPNPPANRAPSADFTAQQQDGTLTVAFSGARSSDPDGDRLSYRWAFGDGTSATTRDYRKTYRTSDNYRVSLTVTDPDGASDTETKTVTVRSAGGGGGGGGDNAYTLIVTKPGNGSGTVTSDPAGISCGTNCTTTYSAGTDVTLTATAADNSTFAGWGGACSGSGATCTVTMSEARTVEATFNATSTTPTTYTLTVTKSGDGSGTVTSNPAGISCGDDCDESYATGTQVTLTATAAEGSTFASWGGACSGSNATCIVTMSEARTVTATFKLVPGPIVIPTPSAPPT